MTVNQRFDHHAKLFATMADTLGVDLTEKMQRGEVDSEDLRMMVHKCTGCTSPCDCVGWLADNAEGAEVAPSYCRNGDELLTMKD